VEEAAAIRQVLRDAEKVTASTAPPKPPVMKPSPSSADAGEMGPAQDDLFPEEPRPMDYDLEDRLPVSWEKKIAAVHRKWFVAGRNEFITDMELKTYVQSMGWADSSKSDRTDAQRSLLKVLTWPWLKGRKGREA
jgi:hypothetical protein